MRQVRVVPVSQLERLARRICKAANAGGAGDTGAIVSTFKQRTSTATVAAAIELAVAKQWLRNDGEICTVTQAGAGLGCQSRRGPRARRSIPV